MSYTIGLLVGTAPSNDAAAFEHFNALVGARDLREKPHPTFVAVHAELTARFPCLCNLADDEVDDGVWSDGPLINNFGARQAVIGFMFSTVETVLPFVIEVANKHGITVLDWQTETIHRPGDLVLVVEGDADLRNPTEEQVDATLERLTPCGGPGFAILQKARDYVQTAGGDGLFTVEWRQTIDDRFRHFVAGKDGDTTTEVAIPTNGFRVTVKKNECLALHDVKLLFRTFPTGGNLPAEFLWRDVTDRFV
jgi:hypothetical protein